MGFVTNHGCLWVYVYGIRPKCETYTVYGCVCVEVYQAACQDVYGWETICVEVYEYMVAWLLRTYTKLPNIASGCSESQ